MNIRDKIAPDYRDILAMTPEERDAYEMRDTPPCVEDDEFELAFAAQCSAVADEWGVKSGVTDQERVDGAIRGVLEVMDGNLGTVFPQVVMFVPKHGDNACNVFRDGTIVNALVDRTTHFYGGPLIQYDALRRAAAEHRVKEDDND